MVVPNRDCSGQDSGEREEDLLLLPSSDDQKSIQDSFHVAYIIFFTLGTGYLLPWNAFITAVDYFTFLYPDASVDRVFAVVYMVVGLLFLVSIVGWAHRSSASVRINVGLGLFVLSLLIVPLLDLLYLKGRPGLYSGFYVTVFAVALAAVADALVQSGVIGSAGELPDRYMQATVAGTAASGVLVSVLRIITKVIYPQDARGLRSSANLYFSVSIIFMGLCIICYNVAHKLPVLQYYKGLKTLAINKENVEKGSLSGSAWRSLLWDIVGRVKWSGFGVFLIYVVTLSIFPGYITEDVHSKILKDWYSILLISAYNVFDLVGKSLTAIYLLPSENVAVGACIGRLLFYPLFLGCLHGPRFFRTEIPVSLLTCLLGLTNGYFTSVLMILYPKSVGLLHAETAGIVMIMFLVLGLAVGSVVSWFWVI